jgi:hypothetical protein
MSGLEVGPLFYILNSLLRVCARGLLELTSTSLLVWLLLTII